MLVVHLHPQIVCSRVWLENLEAWKAATEWCWIQLMVLKVVDIESLKELNISANKHFVCSRIPQLVMRCVVGIMSNIDGRKRTWFDFPNVFFFQN